MAEKETEVETEVTTVEEDPETALENEEVSLEEETDSEEESEEDKSEDESEEEAESEDEKSEEEDKPEEELSDEDKQKQHNREMAEKRLKTKAERDATLKKQQQDYVAKADPEKPEDAAIRQLQVDAYNNKVDANTNKLTNGYERAIKDFDILTDAAPEIQAEVNAALDAFQGMYVTMDSFGNPTEVRSDIYKYLQAKADSITALTGKGARQQEKSKAKEKSKVTPTPTRAPKTPKVDPDIEGFDEEADRW